MVQLGFNTSIRGNSIFSNAAFGILLAAPDCNFLLGCLSLTPNDPCDLDSGPNNLTNFPILSSAINEAGVTTILGSLNSTPNTTFTIDFYSNTVPDGSTNGQGKTHIGSTTATTDGSCAASFVFTSQADAAGDFITAAVTDQQGNTSEFSAPFPLALIPRIDSASISGKNLVVRGSNFDTGSQLLVNGAGQTTVDSSSDCTTLLIGKKVGKDIASGDTVMLTVRTSAGQLSPQFAFHRP